MSRKLEWGALALFLIGAVGCAIGIVLRGDAFYPAWLCAFLFWLGLPLAAVTLALVHDLTGGRWMAIARPALEAAVATMPLATIAGIAVMIGRAALYPWPTASGLGNAFYLNSGFFVVRYAVDIVLWNLLAAYALWAPRGIEIGVPPALSWLSAVGLLLLAYTASFAAIDWVLSLDPHFWSAVFPMIMGAGWFNTGLALVLIAVAFAPASLIARDRLADLAAILLATIIFWAYVEFCQYLIVWEGDLAHEIPWYLHRLAGGWKTTAWGIGIVGFLLPFWLLLWGPLKRSRAVVIAVCALILLSRFSYTFWLVLPGGLHRPAWWLDGAALLALGGLMLLVFLRRLRLGPLPMPLRFALREAR